MRAGMLNDSSSRWVFMRPFYSRRARAYNRTDEVSATEPDFRGAGNAGVYVGQRPGSQPSRAAAVTHCGGWFQPLCQSLGGLESGAAAARYLVGIFASDASAVFGALWSALQPAAGEPGGSLRQLAILLPPVGSSVIQRQAGQDAVADLLADDVAIGAVDNAVAVDIGHHVRAPLALSAVYIGQINRIDGPIAVGVAE